MQVHADKTEQQNIFGSCVKAAGSDLQNVLQGKNHEHTI